MSYKVYSTGLRSDKKMKVDVILHSSTTIVHSSTSRTTDVTGVCNLPEGVEMCMPGDNVEMSIELIHPVAMEQGLRFAIREGGRTVGSGRVATIVE